MTIISSVQKQTQEDRNFEVSPGYLAIHYLKKIFFKKLKLI